MGRTLHYKVFCDKAKLDAAWPEIRHMQDAMNRDFSWSCETLALEPLRETLPVIRASIVRADRPAPTAWGFTKVRENEWNAMLVFCFCQWLSERIPEAGVKLYDEGDLVLGGHVEFRGGAVTIDAPDVPRGRWPRSGGAPDGTVQYRSYLGESLRHVFLHHVPAIEYAEVAEIKALGLSTEELAHLGVHEVALRVRFPWERSDRTTKQP
jgi:hypothetical protein